MTRELQDILQAVEAGQARGEPMALATVVAVSGSTYRREGARLLIYAGGRTVGNISGGCLEGDIAVVAEEVLRDGRPRLATYDLTADDDLVWGLGLGCNGKLEVFVEPVNPEQAEPLLAPLQAVLNEERPVVLAVVLRGTEELPAGTRRVLDPRTAGAGPPAALEGEGAPPTDAEGRLARVMEAALHEGRSRRVSLATASGELDVFLEVLRPPVRLVVVGAGHDAIPLVAQGVALGWRVLVVDRREAYLTSQRFPGATFLHAPFAQAGAEVPLDERTAVVVMTHNYLHDRDFLRTLLARPGPFPFYLGVLGPRARTERMLRELAAEGIVPSPELAARLYAPIGLDVGSESPEEIALAVVAEIMAVERARRAGFLRDRPGPIHAPLGADLPHAAR
ncbi:MAG: XdhC family protein [Armatimonadota bacterium]|nr:XdhC family protein [Armatimonadota bacterium]